MVSAQLADKTSSPVATVKMRSLIDWFLSLFRSQPTATTTNNSGSQSPDPSTDPDHETDQRERPDAPATPGGEPPWLVLARKEDGTKEVAGRAANPKITGYFKSAGHPEVVD